MKKKRCQGILLTPGTRYWAKHNNNRDGIRCKFPAKNETNFCGVHAQLAQVIEKIVWREDCVHSIRIRREDGITFCKSCGSFEDVK